MQSFNSVKNQTEISFEVFVDEYISSIENVDLRIILLFCRINKSLQNKVSGMKWFWSQVEANVIMHHAESSQANLKKHIMENIRDIKIFGFESPSICGIEQIKFINLYARTFTRLPFYYGCGSENRGNLWYTISQLNPYLIEWVPTKLSKLNATEKQQVLGHFSITEEDNIQNLWKEDFFIKKVESFAPREISVSPTIGQLCQALIKEATEIDELIALSKRFFCQPTLKTCQMILPPEIGLFENLEQLNLLDVFIFSDELLKLTNLKDLSIRQSKPCKCACPMPDFLTQMTYLSRLEILNGNLATLPKNFSQLQNLEAISLETNAFEKFPEELFKLTKLKYVNLAFNQIAQIGSDIACLTSLKELDLQGNRIYELPEALLNLNIESLLLDRQAPQDVDMAISTAEPDFPPQAALLAKAVPLEPLWNQAFQPHLATLNAQVASNNDQENDDRQIDRSGKRTNSFQEKEAPDTKRPRR